MSDNVNHPAHYTNHPAGVTGDCIGYTRVMGFCQGNAFKYVYRAGVKGDPDQAIEDLAKARWYLEDWTFSPMQCRSITLTPTFIDPEAGLRANLLNKIALGQSTAALYYLDAHCPDMIAEVTA